MDANDEIISTFMRLKKQYEFTIVLRKVHGHFYVYKTSSRWDKAEKRVKSTQEYLGRITGDGTFIKRLATRREIELDKAKRIIAANGGTIIFAGDYKARVKTAATIHKADETDKKMLTYLSMNARAPVSSIAKFANLSISTTQYRIKQLGERYSIRYMLEVDTTKLGYTSYLVLIKFEGNVPTTEELENVLSNEPKIQFAASTKGEYDVIAYLLEEDITKAIDNFRHLITHTSLGNYGTRWNLIPFATAYSFMPLRAEFIDTVLRNRAWKRTKDNPTPRKEELMQREFILLKELNSDSTKKFSEIDKEHGFDRGTSGYIYHRLEDRGIITRSTITIQNVPIKYIGIITIANIYEKAVEENRYKLLLDTIEYGDVLNKFSFMGNISAPDGAMIFMPVLSGGDLDKATARMENELKGSIVRSLVTTNIIVGSLCYRRFDNSQSRQYKLLAEFGKAKLDKTIIYE